jgi:hypothetical protein
MEYVWYPPLAAAAALWALIDARRRLAPSWWALAVAVGGPFGLAAYLALRPLREGESREGGPPWQLLSLFVVAWTALVALAALWSFAFSSLELTRLAWVWGAVAVPALVVALALKRASIEQGPTGRLAAMARWYPGPERTPDGRYYVCRECGKEYSIELKFCDACGAWPGQSG